MNNVWAKTHFFLQYCIHAQQRLRSACASTQSCRILRSAFSGLSRSKVSSGGQQRHWSACADDAWSCLWLIVFWFRYPFSPFITKTCLHNLWPSYTPFLKIKTGVYRGIHCFFLISAQTHRLWVIVEAVLTNAHYLYFEQKYEKYQKFLSENFQYIWIGLFSWWLCFIRVFVIICRSLWSFPYEVNGPYADRKYVWYWSRIVLFAPDVYLL